MKILGKKEKEDIEILYENIPNETERLRIQSCVEWYIEHAILYKWIFYSLSIIGIVLPLVVTAINAVGNEEKTRFVTIICSVLISLCASLLTLTKCHEKWTLYRSTLESMKRVLMHYWCEKEENREIRDLILELEECMEAEHLKWAEFVTAKESSKNNEKTNEDK